MMARHTLSPPDMNPEGIAPGEWVKMIRFRGTGRVEEVNGDTALVNWLTGSKSVVACVYLRRVPCGEGIDGRRPE